MRPTGQLLGFKLTSESPAPSLEPLARLERGPGVGSRLSDCGLVPHTPDRLPGRGRPGWALRALGRLGRRRGRHGTCTGPRQWLRPAACPSPVRATGLPGSAPPRRARPESESERGGGGGGGFWAVMCRTRALLVPALFHGRFVAAGRGLLRPAADVSVGCRSPLARPWPICHT